MSAPLMMRETASWLLQNTSLTNRQIATSCNLNILEVTALRKKPLRGENPFLNGQLTPEEVGRCEKDSNSTLEFTPDTTAEIKVRKEKRYTSAAVRQEKPRGVLWVIKNYPHLTNAQIGRLLSVTSKTVQSMRDNLTNPTVGIAPQSPVLLGLCSEKQLQTILMDKRSQKAALKIQQSSAQETRSPKSRSAPDSNV